MQRHQLAPRSDVDAHLGRLAKTFEAAFKQIDQRCRRHGHPPDQRQHLRGIAALHQSELAVLPEALELQQHLLDRIVPNFADGDRQPDLNDTDFVETIRKPWMDQRHGGFDLAVTWK